MEFLLTRFPLTMLIVYLIIFLFNLPWVFGSYITFFSIHATFLYIRLQCSERTETVEVNGARSNHFWNWQKTFDFGGISSYELWNDTLNPLTPKEPYSERTATLTSKRCILYIYSTNIGTEYFRHGIYSSFFFSSKCTLFHNSNVFGSCIIHTLYTECAKIKKKNPTPKG